MATINGAKALGLDNITGSVEVKKSADLIAINLNHISTQPVYNPISQIVYAASRDQVTDVWVAGRQLLRNKELTSINEQVVFENIEEWRQRLFKIAKK
jgi:5-methylthioadenosine/S-adenosylhomocysteine deaminase